MAPTMVVSWLPTWLAVVKFSSRMDLLLGTLGRQVPTLATIPKRFGCACTLALLTASLYLGLRCSRRSTRTRQMTDFSTFSARLVGVRAGCCCVVCVSASWTCLLRLVVTFATTFRSLATLAWCSFAWPYRSWLSLSRGDCSRDRNNFAPERRAQRFPSLPGNSCKPSKNAMCALS